MSFCPSCGAASAAGARFCTSCGSALSGESADPDAGATVAVTSPGRSSPHAHPPSPRSPSHSSSETLSGFPPGTMLAGRYRIVGLLGRGGMGEVYRADDLTLGQAVALKFLPEEFRLHPDRLERFYNEVRTARMASHPNLCRVFDIGEMEGRPYYTMEFVDGEDLASLLRRIGRLPQEKGLEIARQMCAGLAALHDRGILHRDLKPANVMIDGRGRVRITDFGLSAEALGINGDERAGTPAYMSPEQLEGREVSPKSDLYALGLIFYELFTGRRAFEAKTLAEISRMHRESTPASPSVILSDFDPILERVITRCLEKDPAKRPASAISVAAALPGGDPLAAALAAGEVPSPEMVAAGGTAGGIRPVFGAALVVAALVGIYFEATILTKTRIHTIIPMGKPPLVLEERGRQILTEIGHTAPARDHASSYGMDSEITRWIEKTDSSKTRWDVLRSGRLPVMTYWLRESPDILAPKDSWGKVGLTDPAPIVPGMATVMVDPIGRLVGLRILPGADSTRTDSTLVSQSSVSDSTLLSSPPPAPWPQLFQLADLNLASFTPVEPEVVPAVYADERMAWTGMLPADREIPIRVEAASYRGKPVWFRIQGPWSKDLTPGGGPSEETSVGEDVLLVVLLSILALSVYMAQRNLRLGRGDRQGAARLAGFIFFAGFLGWLFTAHHNHQPDSEIEMVFNALGLALFFALLFASLYLALEPYVRRIWPDRMISWTRLLLGRWNDPLIGRDILLGGAMFFCTALISVLHEVIDFGYPPAIPTNVNVTLLESPGDFLDHLLSAVTNSIFNPMFFLMLLFLFRLLLRKQWLAGIAFVLLVSFFVGNEIHHGWIGYVSGVLWGTIAVFFMLRFGFLAFATGFFLHYLCSGVPLTLDTSKWYFGHSAVVMALAAGLILFGFTTALAGRSLVRDDL